MELRLNGVEGGDGTNFAIAPGDGIALEIKSSFDWDCRYNPPAKGHILRTTDGVITSGGP